MSAAPQIDLTEISAAELEAVFDAPEPMTVGLEEEVMLLDPVSLELSPCAGELLARLDDGRRFKPEMPASQVEIVVEPSASVEKAIESLAAGRRDLADAAGELARPAVAGVHPFSAAAGELSSLERYDRLREEYGWVARRQLVASLQVHVAVGGARRTLSVYNALRGYLPQIAALAANAAVYEGRDTGLASVRPTIAATLPRQGMPPAIASWAQLAGELRWGARSGAVAEPRMWWWELRPHIGFGTLEVRVPDAQTTLADAAGIAAFVQSLAATLARRYEDGEPLRALPSWRIEENRWSALRHGVEGEMADLETGETEPTRACLRRLLAELAPEAERLGADRLLANARELAERNGALRQREAMAERGARGVAERLCELFLGHDGSAFSPEARRP